MPKATRNPSKTETRWIGQTEVCAILGCKRSRLFGLRTDGRSKFPKPTRIGRQLRWAEAEIVAWLAAQRRHAQ